MRRCSVFGPPAWRKGNRRLNLGVASVFVTEATMRSILLWLIGLPIPIIILLKIFGVF